MALGKLGGSELSVHSDLDLVVLYRGDSSDSDTFVAFQRFVRDMERCLEEPTEDGVAFHVDTRLRPEGRKGALAIPVGMFQQYLASRAEIWERLAWTRSRVLAGAAPLAREVEDSVRGFVYGPWDAADSRLHDGHPRPDGARAGRSLRRAARLQDRSWRPGRHRFPPADDSDSRGPHAPGVPGSRHPPPARTTSRDGLSDRPGSRREPRRAHGFLRSLETFARMETDTNTSAVAADPARFEVLGRRLGLADPAADALVETFGRETELVRGIYRNVVGRL